MGRNREISHVMNRLIFFLFCLFPSLQSFIKKEDGIPRRLLKVDSIKT